jgi:hypothetical protein
VVNVREKCNLWNMSVCWNPEVIIFFFFLDFTSFTLNGIKMFLIKCFVLQTSKHDVQQRNFKLGCWSLVRRRNIIGPNSVDVTIRSYSKFR